MPLLSDLACKKTLTPTHGYSDLLYRSLNDVYFSTDVTNMGEGESTFAGHLLQCAFSQFQAQDI